MKNYLLLLLLSLSVHWSNAQGIIKHDDALKQQLGVYKLKAGDTYTQTYFHDQLGNTLQIRARQRFSFGQIAKKSLPFLAGAAYGIFGGKTKSVGQEVAPVSGSKLPSILGGAAISGASFALKSNKKASVKLTYRNALGQAIHSENWFIKTGKKANIGLWRSNFESVDVSVTAPVNQGVNVQQGARQAAPADSSGNAGGPQTNNDCPSGNCPDDPDGGDNYQNYLGSISNPYQYTGFYNAYADQQISYSGGNTFYYSGTSAYGAGYYNDPSFTEPGGAGYYPMDNPGPAPVNGPGLYPKSRQAEVYQYLWQHQSDRNVEQDAFITNEGIFILPDHGSTNGDNTLTEGQTLGFPGIKVENGINGQKSFTYKGTLYHIEGIVHTHPPYSRYPQGADGASLADRNVANYYNATSFIIADEGIWRIRPNATPPGEVICSDYLQIFNSNYTISNLYDYK